MRVIKQLFWVWIFLVATAAFAQQSARLTDDEVKQLIEDSEKSSDKFRDAFKKVSTLTTRDGIQVDVKKYMQDYKDTMQRFKEGFDAQKTPSSDLMNLFRMTGEVDSVMTRNPDAAGAGSEWQAHKFNMERLAQAFRTSISEDAPPPKRVSDGQMKEMMEAFKEGSKSLTKGVKDAMKKDKTFDKETISATEQSFKLLEKKAETMRNLFNDKKPLGIEMQDFLRQMDVVKSFLAEHPLSSAVQSQWNSLETKANLLKDEFYIES